MIKPSKSSATSAGAMLADLIFGEIRKPTIPQTGKSEVYGTDSEHLPEDEQGETITISVFCGGGRG